MTVAESHAAYLNIAHTNAFKRWFKPLSASGGDPADVVGRIRRWSASTTDRLNRAHWSDAIGGTVNDDLVAERETLLARCELELANNADVEGVVGTYANDVVGPVGPTLQVLSDDEGYNDAFEAAFGAWWTPAELDGDNGPDSSGQMAGPQMLRQWVRQPWTAGEFIVHFTDIGKVGRLVEPAADGGRSTGEQVTLRLHTVHPRRLITPLEKIRGVIMGVRRNKFGKPQGYYIDQTAETDEVIGTIPKPQEYPATDIIHAFLMLDPGQARGIPWLAAPLPSIAELRDYDVQVLDAARGAAEQCTVMQSRHAEIEPVTSDESVTVKLERRMLTTLPAGWELAQVKPEQPTAQYIQFHDEHLRRFGRVVGMPLMITKLDSSGHNYSSARFDGQSYGAAVRGTQAWIEQCVLSRILRRFRLEFQALERRETPTNLRYKWLWPRRPHVDPKKEGDASEKRLTSGVSNYAIECAALELDWKDNILQQERERKFAREHGVRLLGMERLK